MLAKYRTPPNTSINTPNSCEFTVWEPVLLNNFLFVEIWLESFLFLLTSVLGLSVLGLSVLGLSVLGLSVLGLSVLGLSVLGLSVLGLSVLGLSVLGLDLLFVYSIRPLPKSFIALIISSALLKI